MFHLLDGRKLSRKILKEVKKKIEKNSLRLRLAVVQVGKNPVSEVYIRNKCRAAKKVGMKFKVYRFASGLGTERLKEEIKKICQNPRNSGIIIQLPLPKKFSQETFLNLIPWKKDIDVLSSEALGKFYQGRSKVIPPTVDGILEILEGYKIRLKGKNVAVVGAGKLVGLPLSIELIRRKATISILNEFTKDPSSFTKRADILISGVGKPGLIRGDMVKRGVVVVDAGTKMVQGKLKGDVDFQSVSKKAGYITPVPGGVGPLTVACLLRNLVKLNLNR